MGLEVAAKLSGMVTVVSVAAAALVLMLMVIQSINDVDVC